MEINWVGIVAATAAFLGIWLGHVTVRVIEARAPKLWLPVVCAAGLGLALIGFSLSTPDRLLSAAAGILGVTLLWDGFEFIRQEKRVKKGHAPANPDNPRHRLILAGYPTATTLDLLDRDPLGRPLTEKEAVQLGADHR